MTNSIYFFSFAGKGPLRPLWLHQRPYAISLQNAAVLSQLIQKNRNYITYKVNSRLHFLRQLKRAAVSQDDMLQFLARDSMLSALYAIARPSVRLSVCHTGGSVKNG